MKNVAESDSVQALKGLVLQGIHGCVTRLALRARVPYRRHRFGSIGTSLCEGSKNVKRQLMSRRDALTHCERLIAGLDRRVLEVDVRSNGRALEWTCARMDVLEWTCARMDVRSNGRALEWTSSNGRARHATVPAVVR